MGADLSLCLPSGRFNLRVGAVILHEGRLLAMQDENAPYYYLPGGRIRLHETAEDAILRELREELAIEARILRPLWVHQNFFTWQVNGERFHEWCLYFLTDVSGTGLDGLGDSFVRHEGRHTHVFTWLDVDTLSARDLVPPFLREGAAHPPDSLTLLTRMEGEPAHPAEYLAFAAENSSFSLRVRGLYLHEGRVLTEAEAGCPVMLLPGGCVRLHETAEDALRRAMRAELGAEAPMIRPLWLDQAFRTGRDGIRRHEWCLYALLTPPEELLARGPAFTWEEGERRLAFCWTPVNDLHELQRPDFLRQALVHLPDTLQLTTHRA
ncbi:MAG: NUDIX domain-containing protein [Aristaeellaceae bacterium]